jgi:hypothetical protein
MFARIVLGWFGYRDISDDRKREDYGDASKYQIGRQERCQDPGFG